MKVVIGSRHLGDFFARQLADAFPEVEFEAAYDEAAQRKASVDADVFFGWPSREAFLSAKKLRWIHCPGMGIDRIVATKEIVESDVIVTNAPGPHVVPMADWVLGVMLALAHRLPDAIRDQQTKRWPTGEYEGKVVELAGAALGIYGLGSIGRAVAVRAASFGMTIRAVDPAPAEIPECVADCWPPKRLDDLTRASSWLVVTAPIKPETRKTINRARIGLMPKSSYVVVASRGGIVDETALAAAVASGHLAGAALDATEVEPLPRESPFWSMPNVIITPHASALSPQLYEGRRQIFMDNLRRFLRGDQPLHIPEYVPRNIFGALCGQWTADLKVTCNIDKQVYGTYRPTIINRTTTKMWLCGTDGVNVPLTWPKGFLLSSVSAGGFMCGTEHRPFGETFIKMANESDQKKLLDLSAQFYGEVRRTGAQIGIVSVPSFPLYNPQIIESWEMLPEGKGSLAGFNNLHRIKLKQK